MIDHTQRHISSLSTQELRRLAFAFIYNLRIAGIPAYIGGQGARRTHEEQRKLVAAGRSRALDSKHLHGRAFDIDILGFGRDQLPHSFWMDIGRYGESLGLRWGGRFNAFFDGGHFEI